MPGNHEHFHAIFTEMFFHVLSHTDFISNDIPGQAYFFSRSISLSHASLGINCIFYQKCEIFSTVIWDFQIPVLSLQHE
jgi:hypothetical protein